MRRLSTDITIPGMVADTRRPDYRCRWGMETLVAIGHRISGPLVSILLTPVIVGTRETGGFLPTGVLYTVRGMTQVILITTDHRWCLTVITLTMFQAIMTCIAQAIGTVTSTDFQRTISIVKRVSRLVVGGRFVLSPVTACSASIATTVTHITTRKQRCSKHFKRHLLRSRSRLAVMVTSMILHHG